MIHYQLQCGAEHAFDAWFRDSLAYEEQARAGLLECPVCGERQVVRALMAPALQRKGSRSRRKMPEPKTEPAPTAAAGLAEIAASNAAAPGAPMAALAGDRLPDQARAMLQRLRAEVERSCDYVGDDFAAEARRIHEGESQRRGIYGEASDAQAEALREDGIEVGRIPWLPRSDA